jgi:hypothetical protein
VGPQEAVEGEIGAVRLGLDRALQDLDAPAGIALLQEVRQSQVGREDSPVEGEAASERLLGGGGLPGLTAVLADLRLQIAEDEAVLVLAKPGEAGLDLVGLAPLPLLLVQLLHSDEGVDVLRVRGQDLLEGARGAVDEPRLLEVHAEAGEGVRPLRAREIGAREEALVDRIARST